VSPAGYALARRRLLEAAAWNGYVARKGLNAAEGAQGRRENQAHMAELRRERQAGKVAA
jgi:hypothetical protein